jgi:hypothetical protein
MIYYKKIDIIIINNDIIDNYYTNMSEFDNYITCINKVLEKKNNLKLSKYNDNTSEIILYFISNGIDIKLITDFNKYCYIIESKYNFKNFNLNIINKNKTVDNIIYNLLIMIEKNNKELNILKDPFNISLKKVNKIKYNFNYDKLEHILDDSLKLIKPNIISKTIVNEIMNVNLSDKYKHFIIPSLENPYIFNAKFIFNNLQNKSCEIIFRINPYKYTLIPQIEYIKTKVGIKLINIIISNINYIGDTKLDYIIEELGKKIEENIELVENINLEYSLIEYNLIIFSIIISKENYEINYNQDLHNCINSIANNLYNSSEKTKNNIDILIKSNILDYIIKQLKLYKISFEENSKENSKENSNKHNIDNKYKIGSEETKIIPSQKSNYDIYINIMTILIYIVPYIDKDIILSILKITKPISEKLKLLLSNNPYYDILQTSNIVNVELTNEFLLQVYCNIDNLERTALNYSCFKNENFV